MSAIRMMAVFARKVGMTPQAFHDHSDWNSVLAGKSVSGGVVLRGGHVLQAEDVIRDAHYRLEFRRVLFRSHPIGRYGEPAEIGETAAWLLSDASSFVTGAAIAADGGYTAI